MPSPLRWHARCSETRLRSNGKMQQTPDEERYGMIGMVQGRLLFVGFTMRGGRIRIITARKAEPCERRKYHEENREP